MIVGWDNWWPRSKSKNIDYTVVITHRYISRVASNSSGLATSSSERLLVMKCGKTNNMCYSFKG